ncbi:MULTISPECIES: tyrosine-type recombinase/integrase [Paenibacillus]|uniref:Tyrosine-type recombinase/integrase n=1 Tax=Paenibacillus vandeheii TaxID=3035917 RepID=A0ABT8JIR8_9BACL|nr:MULTISPECIES: tyrosine-type recombinase/integrase [Paenibacillus]KGP78303.1 hypothetical protein P363_0132315 [Paenibacillus sp. MAEPY1]KGP78425.1 hypothetical protein P364_0128720 [Paenibacillus sp. MAEPY2]MDN4604019.1 tyrosine-type recombinase/integrase [Paenibacillus vandeheii]
MSFYKEQEYVEYLQSNKKKQLTIRSYSDEIHSFMAWFNKNYPTTEYMQISRPAIVSYLETERIDKSEGTIDKKISILHSYFDFLWSQGYLAGTDPASKIKRLKKNISETIVLTPLEQTNLRNWLVDVPITKVYKAYRDRALLTLCLSGGLTGRELQYLKLEDIVQDRDRLIISIIGEKRRDVAIYNEDAHFIVKYIGMKKNKVDAPPYLFTNHNSEPVSQRVIQFIFSKISKEIGFQVYPRILRNTFAINKYKEGFSSDDVSALLGIINWKPIDVNE